MIMKILEDFISFSLIRWILIDYTYRFCIQFKVDKSKDCGTLHRSNAFSRFMFGWLHWLLWLLWLLLLLLLLSVIHILNLKSAIIRDPKLNQPSVWILCHACSIETTDIWHKQRLIGFKHNLIILILVPNSKIKFTNNNNLSYSKLILYFTA